MTKNILAAAAGAFALSTTALSAVLVPGSSSALSGWAPAASGNTVFSQNYAFTAIDVPQGSSAVTGVLEQTITTQPSGGLLFGLRVSQLNSESGAQISSIEMAGWKTFSVDTDFLLGSGATSPEFVERSGFNNGGNLKWSEFTAASSDDKSSSWLQVATDAVGFVSTSARLSVSFSDGSRALIFIAAPSSIPAPGAAALLLGAVACVVRRRR